ncbi:hypothetical protein ACFE04_008682 [Oxalis oulophora]
MLKSTLCLLLLLLATFIFLQIRNGVCLNSIKPNEISSMLKRGCNKNIEDCFTEPEMMESETNRRMLLMEKKYISYETLKRDMVPCDQPGASYYQCHVTPANHYQRGCEVITRCARQISDTQT